MSEKKKSKLSKFKDTVQTSPVTAWVQKRAGDLAMFAAALGISVAVLVASMTQPSANNQITDKLSHPEHKARYEELLSDLDEARIIDEDIHKPDEDIHKPMEECAHECEPAVEEKEDDLDNRKDGVLPREDGLPECVVGDGTATPADALRAIGNGLDLLARSNRTLTRESLLEICMDSNSRFCFMQNIDADETWKTNEQEILRLIDEFLLQRDKGAEIGN